MGGPTGKVELPAYVSESWAHWMYASTDTGEDAAWIAATSYSQPNMRAALDYAWNTGGPTSASASNSPWNGMLVYQPDADLDAIQDRVDIATGLADGMSEVAQWITAFETVRDSIGDFVDEAETLDEANILAYVAAFRTRRLADLGMAYNRVGSQYFEANATAGSVYPVALALLETAHAAEIADYEAKLRIAREEQRTNTMEQLRFVLTAVGQVTGLAEEKMQRAVTVAQLQAELGHMRILAKVDEQTTNIQWKASDHEYAIKLLKMGSDILGAASGVPGLSEGQKPLDRALMYYSTAQSMRMGRASVGTSILPSLIGLASAAL